METLHLGIDMRDFDLERLGFSLSVLDPTNKRQTSEAYLRMTLAEMNAFLKALRAADKAVKVSTFETAARRKPAITSPGVPSGEDSGLAYSLRR
jgi:hypothetical protein